MLLKTIEKEYEEQTGQVRSSPRKNATKSPSSKPSDANTSKTDAEENKQSATSPTAEASQQVGSPSPEKASADTSKDAKMPAKAKKSKKAAPPTDSKAKQPQELEKSKSDDTNVNKKSSPAPLNGSEAPVAKKKKAKKAAASKHNEMAQAANLSRELNTSGSGEQSDLPVMSMAKSSPTQATNASNGEPSREMAEANTAHTSDRPQSDGVQADHGAGAPSKKARKKAKPGPLSSKTHDEMPSVDSSASANVTLKSEPQQSASETEHDGNKSPKKPKKKASKPGPPLSSNVNDKMTQENAPNNAKGKRKAVALNTSGQSNDGQPDASNGPPLKVAKPGLAKKKKDA